MKPEWFTLAMILLMFLLMTLGATPSEAFLTGIWLVVFQIYLRVARVK